MGKKHKKDKWNVWSNYYSSGKKSKKGKSNKEAMNEVRRGFKGIKPTVDKTEGKKAIKATTKVPEVDKKFKETREKCNHADGRMTVAEFEGMSMTPEVFTPALKVMTNTFGAENLSICKRCAEVLVADRNAITPDDVRAAIAHLYGAIGIIVSHRKLNRSEVREMNKLANKLLDFLPEAETLAKIQAKYADEEGTSIGGGSIASLNHGGVDID